MDATAKVAFVVGAPGSGKGTLCKKLSHDYGFQHLSVGDMLRQRVSVSGLDAETTALVQKGELVPTHTMIGILQDHIDHHVPDSPRVIMVDGFPRRLDQALAAEKQFGAPVAVLLFDCDEKTAERRFLTRKLPGRESDDASLFTRRYREFAVENAQITSVYQERDLLITIDTSGETKVSYEKLLVGLKATSLARFLPAQSRTAAA